METSLDKVMDGIMAQPGVYGCLFADDQGLGLAAKGRASVNSAGVINAIASLAAKLEPAIENPIITYENDSRVCIVKKTDSLTGAIFKSADRIRN
ncbi:hypothetical protein WA026_010713 [Henosepilachna vigintioctopunctata]|uniref:Late endosomal/lysosomal adaptor and MAPK and MTOR activator 5 n=1 Tax=Henosepilachna vigintioctopunctata TaxID=420089 RepID=A0AAW1UVQ6_9CUCU